MRTPDELWDRLANTGYTRDEFQVDRFAVNPGARPVPLRRMINCRVEHVTLSIRADCSLHRTYEQNLAVALSMMVIQLGSLEAFRKRRG